MVDKWTQALAIELCRKIEAMCPPFGCHVALKLLAILQRIPGAELIQAPLNHIEVGRLRRGFHQLGRVLPAFHVGVDADRSRTHGHDQRLFAEPIP